MQQERADDGWLAGWHETAASEEEACA